MENFAKDANSSFASACFMLEAQEGSLHAQAALKETPPGSTVSQRESELCSNDWNSARF